MSEEIQGMVVKVGITDDLFTQGISNMNRSMNVLQSEFKASAESLKGMGSSTDQLVNRQDFLTRAMEIQKAKVQALKDAYENAKTSTGEFSNATQSSAIRLNNAITAMSRMENELTQVNTSLTNGSNEMNNINTSTNKAGEQFKNFGKVAMVGVVAIGSAFGAVAFAGVKMSEDLTKALNGVQSATGYSDEAMSGMKDTMLNIYNNNFGENFEDIGKAIEEVGKQTSTTGKELEGLTTNALLVRDVFGFEVNESIRSANMMMQQFGMSGEEAYNLITQGAQWGLDKNGDLLDSINEYSVQFKQAGFSAEEMFNMLNNGAMGGTFSVDKLGDAVKEFSIRSKDGSKGTSEAFKTLGLDAQATSLAFAKGGEIGKKAFEDVNKKLLEMKDPLAQNQLGVALWGVGWEDLGIKGIKALTDTQGEISNTENALQKINEVKYNTLGESFQGIKRNLETGILLPLGEKILPILSQFSMWFIEHMPEIKQNVSNAMDVIIPILESMGKSFIFIKDNADILIPVLAGVVGGIVAFKVISTITALMEAWKIATVGMTAMQWLLNIALNANPIGLVVLAIGVLIAAGVALYQNWDKVSGFLGKCWTGIKETATWAFNGLKDFLGKWGLDILTVFVPFLGIPLQIIKHWDQIKSFFSGLKDYVAGKIKDMFSFEMPHIKLPHFNIKGSFDLLKGEIPSLGVNWYAKGGIFNAPSVIGVGEAGQEAVLPINKLDELMASAINKAKGGQVGNQPLFVITNFYNNTDRDIETLMYEMEICRKKTAKAIGGM